MKSKLRMIGTGMLLVASMSATVFAQGGGDATYKAKCQMCHGASGLGDTPAGKSMKVPAFNSPDIAKLSEADMIAATKNGKGKMPAYKDKLTDAQIKDVIGYIRTLEKK